MSVELSADATLSHYRIIAPIGAGGMGEVYLAVDTRLDRKVAIKVLGGEFNNHEDRLRRFSTEAKAASALNHPNILTVHDIGQTDSGTHFIATEYINGETLRHHIQHARMKLREALEIITQVASALATAHQAGIIHRDIKPENIMIRPDGYVKVLDFGLAKLIERSAPTIDSEAATVARKVTDPGTIMGTVAYMSPEQARGKEVDARTDIFSLGIVLYEMVAGRPPFAGESSTDVLAAILEREPPPLLRFADETPAELQRIVTKCLRKERDERYQTMKDVLLDLRELRDELALEAKLERSIRPATSQIETQQTLLTEAGTTHNQSAQVTGAASAPTTSSAEYLVGQLQRHKRGAVAALLIGLVAVVGAGYWLFGIRTADARPIESIAVMPFVNEGGNADVEYLSDGMTETLISSLSQLPKLKVKARSSVFRYKGKEGSPQTIGKELNVQAILNGRVAQRGDQLTLSLELIDIATEDVIWSEQYNRKPSDLATLQTDVARDVSSKLRMKFSGTDAAKVGKNYTANAEAYQLYLKGRFYWNKRTIESLKKTVEFYNQAIEKDPNYALAYSGLAETYGLFSLYSIASPNDSMPQAKAAALRALEIDDSLAEAHGALGKYLSYFEFDRAGGEKEFRRAVELNPNYATAHQWLAVDVLLTMKRYDEALAAINRAKELDPLSPVIFVDSAFIFICTRRYDDAIAEANQALMLDPTFQYGLYTLAYALDGKAMYAEAIVEYRKALALNDDPYVKGLLVRALAKAGRRGEAMSLLEQLKSDTAKHYVAGYCLAIAYAALGEKEKALDYLEKDIAERSSLASSASCEPALDDLRSDLRFKAMLKRLNLPE